ncbi:ABC transporter substrate-binding protein [Nocardioides sp. YIM 152588]|uniref:ABC transporter substrate-binding protein n=1 Tax=Nocardioides sp. YIM 152588 TaxID=3158259 RepID=UPI0032E50CA6
MNTRAAAVAASLALTLPLAACGENAAAGDAATSGPIKLGVFASLTGPASATFKATPAAAEARIKAYEASGGECADRGFEVVEADDTSTTEGALKAAQKLVQQDKVFAVLHSSSFFYGASQYLTTQASGTPVFGGGFDGAPEYNDVESNLFGVLPPLGDYSATYSLAGDYYKSRGVSKIAMVAYDSPSAANGLDQTKRSAEAAGLEIGYYNKAVPFGTTDVGPIVQGIIESGADGLYGAMNPETTFGIVGGLRQAGYDMKMILLATGYGADLLKSEPAVQAAQGVTFSIGWRPSELGGDAVEAQSEALKEYAGSESGVPSFSEAMGWMTADMFLYALEKAGCDASQQEVIDALRDDDGWDAGGLMAPPRDFGSAEADEQCSYYLTLEDHAFVPEEDASPACGGLIE